MKKLVLKLMLLSLGLSTLIEQSTVESLFKDLNRGRESGESLLVVFYAPTCTHCQKFLKIYQKVVKKLNKEDLNLKFRKADCIMNPNLIIAFRVKYFPFLVYFKKGVPRARMPMFLADYEAATKQWVEMMHSKYSPKEEHEKKVKKTEEKKEKKVKKKKKVDDGYAFLDDLMDNDEKIKGYHDGIKNVLNKKHLDWNLGGEGKDKNKAEKIKAKDVKGDSGASSI